MANLLTSYRAAVVNTLTQQLTDFNTVVPHAGVFNADAIKRLSTLCPAAMVALAQIKSTGRNFAGQFIGPATSVVYVLGRDPTKGEVWGPSIDYAERVADVIELNQFGLDYVAAARVKDIDVLYNAQIDAMALCLAAVSFTQEVTWGTDRNAEDERRDYADWTDHETIEKGWPQHVTGRSHVKPSGVLPSVLMAIRLLGPVNPPPPYPAPQIPDGATIESED